MRNAFLIAATSSGCGKTTLSLGIMRALRRKELNVQPFKCGPDYIDTQYHYIATGNKSVNLDFFMASENHVKALFDTFSYKADVSITEGVMGMFDGYDRMTGSSADIARQIGLPVILLVNAASTSYSVAATIYGFVNLHKDVRVAGVIFNRVASENHYSYLLSACRDIGVESFGYLSRNERLSTPSRHLGLTLSSVKEMNSFIDAAADEVEKHVDLNRILNLGIRQEPGLSLPYGHTGRRVAVARDEAFNFIYPANLLALESKITFFSPSETQFFPKRTWYIFREVIRNYSPSDSKQTGI